MGNMRDYIDRKFSEYLNSRSVFLLGTATILLSGAAYLGTMGYTKNERREFLVQSADSFDDGYAPRRDTEKLKEEEAKRKEAEDLADKVRKALGTDENGFIDGRKRAKLKQDLGDKDAIEGSGRRKYRIFVNPWLHEGEFRESFPCPENETDLQMSPDDAKKVIDRANLSE